VQLVTDSLEELITTAEAASACGVSAVTIRQWKHRGWLAPSGLDQRNRPLYRMVDVLRCERDTRRRALGKTRIA